MLLNEEKIDQLKKALKSAQYGVEKVYEMIERFEQEERKEVLKSLPGVEGVFDGVFLNGDDGKKYEVPTNYAAKSRIVFGDRLKMLEEEGKTIFKQIQKASRKRIEGVISKKEGKWYLLANEGTYKISDTAAAFNDAQINDKAVGIIPDNNDKVPYAALDRIIKPEEKKEKPQEKQGKVEIHHPEYKKENKDEKPKSTKREKIVSSSEKKEEKQKPIDKPKSTKREFVIGIVDDKKGIEQPKDTQGTISLGDDDLR